MTTLLHSFSSRLALLLYFAVVSNCAPVDVALNKPITARVTCGSLGQERFLTQLYVYQTASARASAIQTCVNETSYPATAMVDGQYDTWWQSTSRANIISELLMGADPPVQFDAEIIVDLDQVCIPTFQCSNHRRRRRRRQRTRPPPKKKNTGKNIFRAIIM